MGKINRSKFKSTNVDQLKKQEDEINSKIRRGGGDWLTIDNGSNKFRIFPGHPGSSSFIYPRTVHWLPRRFENKDGETEVKNKPVFNSRVHADTKRDIVEEYYNFVLEKITNEVEDEDVIKKKTDTLSHWKDGILSRTEWVCYAKKMAGNSTSYGLLQITNGIKDKLNEIAITEDPDEVIETDPFTDPDDGKAIIITKDKDAEDPKDYYKVTLEFRGDYSLTDEELEWLLEQDPLEKLYVNSYSRRDFEIALEGLEIYDNRHEFGAFKDPKWIEIVEELDALYPEEDDSKDSDDEPLDVKDDVVEDEGKDEFVDIEALDRSGLKAYITENELPVMVKKNMSDDDIRQAIYEALEEETVEDAVEDTKEKLEAEAEDEQDEAEDEEPEDLSETDGAEDESEDKETSDKIKKMREKLKKGKK